MFRDIFTNKWILGGFLLLIIIASGCYLWYQHSLAADRKAAADAEKLLRQSEIERQAGAKSNTETETTSTQGPAENNTAEKQSADATALTDNTESSQTEASTQTAETPEVRVSKFGFGPYPEIPPDFPYPDLFDASTLDNVHDPDNPNYELMYRVRVELWKRGERGVEGMQTSRRTGLFYPAIRGTIYVEWAPRWKIAGLEVGRRIRAIKGNADDIKRLQAFRQQVGRPLLESDIPSDMKVLDMSEGINPYEFLNLPKPK